MKYKERLNFTKQNSLKKRKGENVYLLNNADAKSHVGDNSVPICGDVTKLDFDLLAQTQLEIGHRQFDVIMMDPPWKLSTSQPSRGVAIQYCSLSDEAIGLIPIPKLQT